MTLLFNVTDAVGSAPNHGITRTERRLAAALAGMADVRFVVMQGGRLWMLADDLPTGVDRASSDRTPHVERLGVDPPPPPTTGRRAALRKLAQMSRRPAEPARSLQLERLVAGPGDALVSVGLDWVHGLVDEAERLVWGRGVRYFGFCHDTIQVDHPEWLFPPDPAGFSRFLQRQTRVATAIVCNSQHTRGDLLRHFPALAPDRAPVLTLGADAASAADPRHHAFAAGLCDGEPYAVYCATVDRRKNHEVLYRALRLMLTDAGDDLPGRLVFVGMTGNGAGDLLDALRHDPRVRGRVTHVTHCDDAHLAAIYARARFAVYPSLYEGWGLGVTEALAHGKPCLVASGSSLGEAGLGVCRELHPLRSAEWAAALGEYFREPPEVPPVAIPTWDAAARRLSELVA